MSNAIRWSDNDKYFGPFTLATSQNYKPFALILGSGDGEEYPRCRLRISAFGVTLITALPQIIKPWRVWVDTSRHSWSTGPDGGYWDTGGREYGFSLSEGFLNVSLGRVTNDSSTEQRKGYFLPWTEWRNVRETLFDDSGAVFYDRRGPSPRYGETSWETERTAKDKCPTVSFAFKDFDGENLTATTRIEQSEMKRGTGKFRWLSLFCKKRVYRHMDIRFSGETGKRKGSWKGGTIGHGIDLNPGELHESAFKRYCENNAMTFGGAS